MKHRTLSVRNGEVLLNYSFELNDSHINLIFLHGWGCDMHIWGGLVDNLQIKDYNVYLLDLPGFGRSILKNKDYDLEDYALCYLDFINKLKLHNNILIGHSLGGRIAFKLAELVNKNKSRIKQHLYSHYAYRQILIAPHGIREDKKIIPMIMSLVSKLIKPIFKFRSTQNLRTRIYTFFRWGDYIDSGELKQVFLNITREDLSLKFKYVSIPTLLVFGADDKVSKLKYGKLMHKEIVGSTLEIIEHAQHFPFLDNPIKIAELINNFVSQKDDFQI